jgi:hypothetical protein
MLLAVKVKVLNRKRKSPPPAHHLLVLDWDLVRVLVRHIGACLHSCTKCIPQRG